MPQIIIIIMSSLLARNLIHQCAFYNFFVKSLAYFYLKPEPYKFRGFENRKPFAVEFLCFTAVKITGVSRYISFNDPALHIVQHWYCKTNDWQTTTSGQVQISQLLYRLGLAIRTSLQSGHS